MPLNRARPNVPTRFWWAIIACMLLLVSMFAPAAGAAPHSSAGSTSPAHRAIPQSACQVYWADNGAYGYWDAAYENVTVPSCVGSAPKVEGWLYPCSGVNVTANMDVWLTQSTVHGSQRLAESGRTGNETWAADCQWHEQVLLYGPGQTFTTPLWGCMWTYDATVNLSFDYLCAQGY